jgi:hypothetical protein
MNVAARVSPIDAASRAIAQTRRQLFPFHFERWLALGLVAFLDQCGRAGGGGGNAHANVGERDLGASLRSAANWISEHALLVVALFTVTLVVVIALTALATWLNSRGTFMYIDNVATGRSDVTRPWREHRLHANSYFVLKFAVALAGLALVIGALVTLFLAAVTIARQGFAFSSTATVVVAILLFFAVVLTTALIGLVLRDFAAPIQLLRGVPCGEALRTLMPVMRAHLGALLLYLLLKICYALVLGVAVIALVCVTCCVALCCLVLPIVAQTLLQPFFYFERAWSLQLLADMGFDLMQGPDGWGRAAVMKPQASAANG